MDYIQMLRNLTVTCVVFVNRLTLDCQTVRSTIRYESCVFNAVQSSAVTSMTFQARVGFALPKY